MFRITNLAVCVGAVLALVRTLQSAEEVSLYNQIIGIRILIL